MSYVSLTKIAVLTLFVACSAMAENSPNVSFQPAESKGTSVTWTQDNPGRWRLIGNLVDSNNRLACGLALASGKCMFTCGPGSPRCEGGTHTMSFGSFDLRDLPTEPDGTIILQTFVAGNIPGRQVIDPSGSSSGQARWTAVTELCCTRSSLNFTITIDGVTKTSVGPQCGSNTQSTIELAATTSVGTKKYTASSACSSGNDEPISFSGTVAFSPNSCYLAINTFSGNQEVINWEEVSCNSSANLVILPQVDDATPMNTLPQNQSNSVEPSEEYKKHKNSP